MDYKIIRSKRKTIGIYICKDGSVEVRCPKNTSESLIENVILSKQSWIDKKVKLMTDRNSIKNSFQLKPGCKIKFLGNLYTIAEVNSTKVGFDGKGFYVPSGLSNEDIKVNIIKLYKKLARNILNEKAVNLSKIMNVVPTDIKVNSAATRWGSCSGKNSVNFSWRLIMADEKAVDYVVVHELAHIKEHNHSKKFWALVKQYAPDYEVHKSALKKLANELASQNWD